jgi:hypothetical protein
MITKKTWNRILIAGILLIVFVIINLALYDMPNAKSGANQLSISGLWIFIGLHLIVLAELIYSRIFSFTVGHFENGFLVAAGFIALFLVYAGSDAAFSGGPNILLFVCVGCDLATAIIAFLARYFRGHLKTGAEV